MSNELQQRKILIVDDEESVRGILMRLLAHMGCTPLVAPSGESAIALIRSGAVQFDCVLLDVAMPQMSGIEAARVIHEVVPELPIVMMSGHAVPALAGQGWGVPVAGFLQKPFSYEELRRMVVAATSRGP